VNALRILVPGLPTALAACAIGPDYRAPQPDMPASFAAQPETPQKAAVEIDLSAWWRALQDDKLNSLVERAVASNLDLQMALARLQQARTYEAVALSQVLPEVVASAGAGRGTGTDLTRGRADPLLRSAVNNTGLEQVNIIAGFDAIWQLDLFGKFRRELEAARADTEAARAARHAVLISVIADVVRVYVNLRGFQVRAAILHRASGVLRESLRIVTIRYQRGITNELDVALAARELATLEGRIAPLEALIKTSQYTLAVLLGEYPENLVQELTKPDLIPSMPSPVAPGVPLDLLKRRPDVQRAERELAAATARIGVATADLFPTVTISATIGAQRQDWGTEPIVGKHIWSFGPSAFWPILDFGALDAQVSIADWAARWRLLNYRKTLLDAVQQVNAALAAYVAQQDRMDSLSTALTAGQRALELANARYDRGLTDYLNVVDAERQLYDLQEQYALAQVAQGEYFVQLYRSLGGGWENYQAVPPIRRPLPAIIAAFRRVLTGPDP
jgi:NodT family efflux transporter outer membrane factor (OMF) lipoprotein